MSRVHGRRADKPRTKGFDIVQHWSSHAMTPAFQWSDENENQQYERYLSYLRSNLSVPRHLSVERAPPSLLDTFKSRYLPFDVRGNPAT